ncbi:MAG: DUF2269 domain-containing protein [Marinovum sp.]|nr:DUF2269 domain-containing protein [Marinovum sp.]
MIDAYELARWLHILSSTVLFGTGIGTAFQMVWAMHLGDLRGIHVVSRGVVTADWLFTTPAGIVQPATGLWLIWLQGWSLWEDWLVVTYVLYVLAFCFWAPVVALQIRIRDLAGEALQRGETVLPAAAKSAYCIWFALGWPAFLALIAVFWLMVTKPTLWS